MNNKRSASKLALTRETLRALSQRDLSMLVGARALSETGNWCSSCVQTHCAESCASIAGCTTTGAFSCHCL